MLVPHKTTAAQKLRIPGIAAAMRDAGIPENQVQTAETVGAYDQDVFNAMALWMDAGSDGRQGLLENLQRNLDAYILVGGF
jgi:hypothetical protein